MPAPTGFAWSERKNGDIAITHHGRVVTLVRGSQAGKLARQLASADDLATQHLLARATGNYKRGNEKQSRSR